MKNALAITAFVFLGMQFIPYSALAMGASPDSTVSASGNGVSLDVGVPGYPGSLFYECSEAIGSGCSTDISATTTAYTILSYGVVENTSDYYDTMSCGSTDIPSPALVSFADFQMGSPASFVSYAPISCKGDVQFDIAPDYFYMQYVPYDISNAQSSDSDIVFGLSIIITILFLMAVGFMYNNMSTKKPWR